MRHSHAFVSSIVLALACVCATDKAAASQATTQTASAQSEAHSGKINSIEIVVVTADGQAVQDAHVAMARDADANISLKNGTELSCYGPEATFLFFRSRNTKTACDGITDENG